MDTVLYDPLDPETLDNPHPLFRELRQHSPVFWHDGMQSWCLIRYDDCVRVLRDHTSFARDRRRMGQEVPAPSLSVQSLDPPAQAPVRSLFMNALRAQDTDALERTASTVLSGLFSDLATRPQFNVMTEVAAPVSVAVISELLGVKQPDIPSFVAISDAIMRSMDGGLDPATVEPGRLAREQLNVLVESWFDETAPRGVLGHVRQHATAEPDREALATYVRNTARVMFQGGYSTMTAAIGNAIQTLMEHPETLRTGSATVAAFADELVRFDGPVQGTSRFAVNPVTIGDVTVQQGQTVVTLFAAANRDPAQFPQPDTLVTDRFPNRHLGYGWGTHSCIGTTPAQAVLRALVSTLADQPGPLRPAGPGTRRRTATMRVFETLPATFR